MHAEKEASEDDEEDDYEEEEDEEVKSEEEEPEVAEAVKKEVGVRRKDISREEKPDQK